MIEGTSPLSSREEYLRREAYIRDTIKPIVNDADPEQLLSTGCHENEYQGEIEAIAKHICRGQGLGKVQLSIDQICHIVANVFSLNFHSWTEFPRMTASYSKLGERIWRALYDKPGAQPEL